MRRIFTYIVIGALTGCASCPSSPKGMSGVKPGGDYHSCDFSSKNLENADFTNTNLTNANFREADVSGSNFSGANISNADFRYSNLENSNFLGAWAGRKMGNYVYDNIGFLTYEANLTGATWVNGKICSANSITTCK